MQTVYKDEDEESSSRRANPVDIIICARRVSRYLERKYLGEAGERRIGIQICEGVLAAIKKEFGGEEKELVKVAELKRLEQGGRTMEEFIQEFRRVARGSRYEGRPLIEEFKREMNGMIRRRLMDTERPPTSIKQWYKYVTQLDRHWRESRRKEERLRG